MRKGKKEKKVERGIREKNNGFLKKDFVFFLRFVFCNELYWHFVLVVHFIDNLKFQFVLNNDIYIRASSSINVQVSEAETILILCFCFFPTVKVSVSDYAHLD